jgi:peptide/nickel transport system permease protein
MARALLRVAANVLVTALVSSFLVFALLQFAPGNPIDVLSGGRPLDHHSMLALRHEYHLNDAFLHRYWLWLTGVLHGQFGPSIAYNEPVSQLLGPRVVTTVLLVTLSSLLIVFGGTLVGVLAALAPRRLYTLLSTLMTVALATPPFVAAIVFITYLAARLGWFPVYGPGAGLPDRLYHLILPACALALSGGVYIARVTDVSVRSELGQEHVQTARIRGLSSSKILRRHVLRNALIPIVTISGVTVASLIAGSVVIETAFGLNGLGSLLVQSVENNDFAVVEAICLVLIVAFILINGLVDAIYVVIDPRLRRKGAQ